MTTKKEKIWMWIFIAMLAVPEILWSPIANFYYEFFQSSKTSNVQALRDSFLQKSDNLNYLKLVIALQFIGLLLVLFSLIKNKFGTNKLIKYLSVILLVILLVTVGFVLYFAMTFSINIL